MPTGEFFSLMLWGINIFFTANPPNNCFMIFFESLK